MLFKKFDTEEIGQKILKLIHVKLNVGFTFLQESIVVQLMFHTLKLFIMKKSTKAHSFYITQIFFRCGNSCSILFFNLLKNRASLAYQNCLHICTDLGRYQYFIFCVLFVSHFLFFYFLFDFIVHIPTYKTIEWNLGQK